MVTHMNPKELLLLTKNPLKCCLPSYLKEILSLSFSLLTMEIHLSFQALPISFLPRFLFPEYSLDIEILLNSRFLLSGSPDIYTIKCPRIGPVKTQLERMPLERMSFTQADLCIDCCYFTLFWFSGPCHRHPPIDVKTLGIAFPTAKK